MLHTAQVAAAAAASLQPCPTLCDPIDGSPPGSPVPGILQAGTLEWGATAFSNAQFISLKKLWESCLGGKKKSIFKRIQPNLFNLVHLAFQDWKKKIVYIYVYILCDCAGC